MGEKVGKEAAKRLSQLLLCAAADEKNEVF
jgi:hypothetical protein